MEPFPLLSLCGHLPKKDNKEVHNSLFVTGKPASGSSTALDDYYSDDGGYSYPSDDDYVYPSDNDYANEHEKVVHFNPTFLSTGTNQLVNEGDTIKLPCLVDKLGKHIKQIFYVFFFC